MQFEYGPSPFDHTQRFVASYVWQTPRLGSSPAFARQLLGGWQLSGIVTAQTGDSFTVYSGTDRSATAGKDRAVVVGAPLGGNACNGAAPCTNWLNPASFVNPLPAVGTPAAVYIPYPYKFGDVGKDSVRGPGLFNWDIGLAKEFFIRERTVLQFRAEFFNASNKVNYSDPVSSISSAGFGSIRTAADPRIGQLAMKLRF